MTTIMHFQIEGESIADMRRRKKLTSEATPILAEKGDVVWLPETFKENGQISGEVISRSFVYLNESSVMVTYTLKKEPGPYLSRYREETGTQSGDDRNASN